LCQLIRQKKPKVVVDLGSGTGISTRIWYGIADLVIGVEPNDDMRAESEGWTKKVGRKKNNEKEQIKILKFYLAAGIG
jgi:SAM-dependent methyltransferase